MRRALAVLVALALPAPASAACPSSPQSNGTGYKPAANARSLPPAGTGPDILHSALPTSPQLENTRNWDAPPILVSGAEAYRKGEFLYQDFLYDDRALPYPDDPARLARNAADFVEIRMEPLKTATAIRVTLNSMLDPDAAAVTIGLGSSDGAREMPHDAGARMPAQVFVTAHGCSGDADGTPVPVSTDLQRRQIQIEVPYRVFDPRGRTVRVGAAVGLWDKAKGEYLRPDPSLPAFYNVAFRKPGPWTQNTWMDSSQNAALKAGDLSPLYADVDFAKLAARTDDESGVPKTGPMNRIMVSRYEEVQGRGNSSGGDIFGNYACDPPACTYQYAGRLQPYSVYVPHQAMPARGYGVVVNLHGANSNHNHFEGGSTEPPLSVWQMLAEQGTPSVMVMPNARGMTYCYYGMAGADVFEAWADAASHYRLDPDQALLTGSSMGGFGVYKLATAFPDLFKAIFPNIAPEICDLTEASAPAGAHTGATGIGDAFASLRNVPVLATSGLDDPLVDVAITTRSAERFDLLGYRYDFWHFQSTSPGGGHAEYRQFVRAEYGALNRGQDTVDRDPRHVTYVLDGYVSDPRYGMRSDHAYWVGGLQLADPGVSPPMGTIDVTSGAIPAPAETALPTESGGGVLFNGSRAYKRQTKRWRAGDPEPLSNTFTLKTTNLKSAELDLRRMRLATAPSIEGSVETDAPLTLRLSGGAAGTRVLTLPAGTSQVRIAQPCRARTVTLRLKAPHGDRLRKVTVVVDGHRVRTVRGRAARRPIRVTLATGAGRVVLRGVTRRHRHLVRRRTYPGCAR